VVVPKFITSLLKGESPPIYGDGNQERDFTYIDNVVEANILSLTTDSGAGESFNVANGSPNSVNKLLSILRDITNKNINAVYLPPRKGDVRKTHADINKIQKILGWQPKIDFYEGLKRTVEWFKNVQSSGLRVQG
jgi:UDP-glucose 4-epimerase